MVTIDYTGLRLTGALRINRLTALELHVGVNEHGWAIVEGEAGENALELLFGRISQRRSQAVTVTVPTHLKIGDTA